MSSTITRQQVVKASKTKNFPYRDEKAKDDKNLILMNREILVMRTQNSSRLRICSVFSNLSSEFSLVDIGKDEIFQIIDMQFIAEYYTPSDNNNINGNPHRNILAVIDNQNRVFIIEINVDYEREFLSYSIFTDQNNSETQRCQQLTWTGQHLLILQQGGIVSDRKINLNNRIVQQKSQYVLPQDLGCRKIVASQNFKQNSDSDADRFFIFGISGDGQKVFAINSVASNYSSVSEKLFQEQNDELCEIIITAYGDIVVMSRLGRLFQLQTQSQGEENNIDSTPTPGNALNKLFECQIPLEVDERIIETHVDNTLTSLFALTSRNQLHHIFLQKVQLKNGAVDTFKSAGISRFHSKNQLFTFRALAAPGFLENCIQIKNNHKSQDISQAFQDFVPSVHSAKYFIYSLLTQDSDNMKIFALSLASHQYLINEEEIAFVFPRILTSPNAEKDQQQEENQFPSQQSGQNIQQFKNLWNDLGNVQSVNSSLNTQQQLISNPLAITPTSQMSKPVSAPAQTNNLSSLVAQEAAARQKEQDKLQEMMEEQFILSTMQNPANEVESQSKYQSAIEEEKEFENKQGLKQLDGNKKDSYYDSNQGYYGNIYQSSIHDINNNQAVDSQLYVHNNNITPGQQVNNWKPAEELLIKHESSHRSALADIALKKQKSSQNSHKTIFENKMDGLLMKFENHIKSKMNKLEAVVSGKVEKMRKDEDVLSLVEKCSADCREKMESVVRDELQIQYDKLIEPTIKQSLVSIFSQTESAFENGQKFYNEKIQQEREKCKIQNENTDEILALVKKITGPFSESAITHKKILTDLANQSNERKAKMEQFDKNLTTLLSRQEQILTKISSLEKNISEQMSEAKISKIVETSLQNQLLTSKPKFDQTLTGFQNHPPIPSPPIPANGNSKQANQYLREGEISAGLLPKQRQGLPVGIFNDFPFSNGNGLFMPQPPQAPSKKTLNLQKNFNNNYPQQNESGKSKKAAGHQKNAQP